MAKAASSIGLFDAKTHLSKLVDRVERGESITITRRGVAVARLVPMTERKRTPAEIAASIRRLRAGNRLGKITLRELIEEGRA